MIRLIQPSNANLFWNVGICENTIMDPPGNNILSIFPVVRQTGSRQHASWDCTVATNSRLSSAHFKNSLVTGFFGHKNRNWVLCNETFLVV